MNLNNVTTKSQEAVQRAQQLAMENGNQAILNVVRRNCLWLSAVCNL